MTVHAELEAACFDKPNTKETDESSRAETSVKLGESVGEEGVSSSCD